MGGALTVQEQRRQMATQFRSTFESYAPQLAAALPEHVSVQKFVRIVITAVSSNVALLEADRTSLFEAAQKSAQDGLLPDGREGAFVIYNNKVQWMPMIAGVLKKVRNSGELLTISAQVAYTNDEFFYVLGDNERIEHTPLMEGDRGKPRAVYAIARTKSGGIYREVMTVAEVEKVRSVSRAKHAGPWKDWWDEMARKTVLRRLAKRLPQSTDLEQVLSRDDGMYDMDRRAVADNAGARLFKPATNPLLDHAPEEETGEADADQAGAGGEAAGGTIDQGGADASGSRGSAGPGFGETRDGPAGQAAGAASDGPPADPEDPIQKARSHGDAQARNGAARKLPKALNDAGREAERDAWLAAYDAARGELEVQA